MTKPKKFNPRNTIKKRGGRPTKYKPQYCQDLIDHFDVPPYFVDEQGKKQPNDLPQFIDFAMKIGICTDTLKEWRDTHPKFSYAYIKARKLLQRNWETCSILGLYNPAFTIFYGKNIFHWKDKHELTGADDGPLSFEIVKFSEANEDSDTE